MPCVYLPGPAPAVTVANSHSKFWLFQPIFRHLDPEYGSGSRLKLNADPTGFGSGSETLLRRKGHLQRKLQKITKEDNNWIFCPEIKCCLLIPLGSGNS